MSTQGFSAQHMLDDAAIRGTLKGAFRKTYDTKAPKWKACGFEQDSTVKPFEEFSSFSGISLAPRREEFSQTATDVPKQNYTMRIRMLEYAVMIPVSDSAVRFLKRGMGSVREFIRPAEMAAESMARPTRSWPPTCSGTRSTPRTSRVRTAFRSSRLRTGSAEAAPRAT